MSIMISKQEYLEKIYKRAEWLLRRLRHLLSEKTEDERRYVLQHTVFHFIFTPLNNLLKKIQKEHADVMKQYSFLYKLIESANNQQQLENMGYLKEKHGWVIPKYVKDNVGIVDIDNVVNMDNVEPVLEFVFEQLKLILKQSSEEDCLTDVESADEGFFPRNQQAFLRF